MTSIRPPIIEKLKEVIFTLNRLIKNKCPNSWNINTININKKIVCLGEKIINNEDNKNIEIDIVAYDSFGTDILFGECKYSTNPKGIDVLLSLMEKANYVPWNKNNRKEYYVLFSRSGYSDELKNYAFKKDNIFLL